MSSVSKPRVRQNRHKQGLNQTLEKISADFRKVLLLLVIACTSFSACSDDDDDDYIYNRLDTYIIGKWHSYKGVVTMNGEKETTEITKNGEYSAAYFEIEFKNDKTAMFYAWTQDPNGLSRWSQEKCTYQVQNDEVILRDSEGETVSLSYDSKEKALYFRAFNQDYDTQMTVFVYLRK